MRLRRSSMHPTACRAACRAGWEAAGAIAATRGLQTRHSILIIWRESWETPAGRAWHSLAHPVRVFESCLASPPPAPPLALER